MLRLGKKKHKCPEPIVLIPAEPSQKDILELKLLEYKAAYERLNWDYLDAVSKVLDDKTTPRYIV